MARMSMADQPMRTTNPAKVKELAEQIQDTAKRFDVSRVGVNYSVRSTIFGKSIFSALTTPPKKNSGENQSAQFDEQSDSSALKTNTSNPSR